MIRLYQGMRRFFNFRISNFYFPVLLSFTATGIVSAQENNAGESQKDSVKTSGFFKDTKPLFENREFFMATINEGKPKDDYAMASSFTLGFKTGKFHGLSIGASGSAVVRLFSSDLENPDPVSGQPNRYEVGLFDLKRPGKYDDLIMLEELFAQYQNSFMTLTAGRVKQNTPFMNPQDGRMRPTFEEGAQIKIRPGKKLEIFGSYVWSVLVRGTNEWHTPGESLGLFPVGRDVYGKKSAYKGNVKSDWVASAEIRYNFSEDFSVSVWDGYIDNLLNTAIIEVRHGRKLNADKGISCYKGIQYLHQDAVGDGGNADPSKAFIQTGAQSNVISVQWGIKNKRADLNVNYTHITGDGRYLMPREWGKEIFYTFLPRERNEGAGNANAFMIKTTLFSKNKKMRNSLGYGYYDLPDVKDYRFNKYNIASFHQINFENVYKFGKPLRGLEVKTIAVWKINSGETYGDPKVTYNKTDMLHLNLIIIYRL